VLVIGKEGRHVPQESALSMIGGFTLGNEGSVRDWLRHGSLNVTQQEFPTSPAVSARGWSRTDETRPAKSAARDDAREREPPRRTSNDRLTWGLPGSSNYISTFATLKPVDFIWTGTPTGAGSTRNPPVWLKPHRGRVESPQIGVPAQQGGRTRVR